MFAEGDWIPDSSLRLFSFSISDASLDDVVSKESRYSFKLEALIPTVDIRVYNGVDIMAFHFVITVVGVKLDGKVRKCQ